MQMAARLRPIHSLELKRLYIHTYIVSLVLLQSTTHEASIYTRLLAACLAVLVVVVIEIATTVLHDTVCRKHLFFKRKKEKRKGS